MKDSAGTMADAYDKVADSASAKLQLLKNLFTGVADAIKTVVTPTLPVLNFGTLLGNNVIAVLALKKAMESFSITQKAVNIVCLAWRSISISLIAITRTLTSVFTGATVGATTLKVALKGLLMTTGVGLAIAAVVEIISHLTSSSDDAADSIKNLKEEELAAQSARKQEAKQIRDVTTELSLNISKLKNFKGSKIEEKKLVQEMNQRLECCNGDGEW